MTKPKTKPLHPQVTAALVELFKAISDCGDDEIADVHVLYADMLDISELSELYGKLIEKRSKKVVEE